MPSPILLLSTPGWETNTDKTSYTWSPVAGLGPAPRRHHTQELAQLEGHWALVELTGPELVISVDRMRSLSLLFARVNDRWVVSDDIETMRAKLPTWEGHCEQVRIFEHLGYTIGGHTLVSGVYCVEAGEQVILRAEGTFTRTTYATYAHTGELTNPQDFGAAFSRALDASIDRLMNVSGNRQLVVPLSGGLDSRLLLSWLVKRGAPHVTAFTYGVPGSAETAISREVAHSLQIPWFNIDLRGDTMAQAWTSAQGSAFQKATWRGTSLPHIQDWFALRQIRRLSLVDDDAIFLPGHTIVGNMHDDAELLVPGVSPATIAATITRHHGTLQGRPKSLYTLHAFTEAIRSAARHVNFDGSADSIVSWVEWFNIRERQAKYINNSMRAYEFFGYTWAAPMLDLQMWDTWLKGSWTVTRNRSWYAEFTNRVFADVTGSDSGLNYFDGASNRHGLSPALHRVLLYAMRLTRCDAALSRYRSVKKMLNHPMAFEAFAQGTSTLSQALYFARGGTSLGLWARMFLENRWGATSDIVPVNLARPNTL